MNEDELQAKVNARHEARARAAKKCVPFIFSNKKRDRSETDYSAIMGEVRRSPMGHVTKRSKVVKFTEGDFL